MDDVDVEEPLSDRAARLSEVVRRDRKAHTDSIAERNQVIADLAATGVTTNSIARLCGIGFNEVKKIVAGATDR